MGKTGGHVEENEENLGNLEGNDDISAKQIMKNDDFYHDKQQIK